MSRLIEFELGLGLGGPLEVKGVKGVESVEIVY